MSISRGTDVMRRCRARLVSQGVDPAQYNYDTAPQNAALRGWHTKKLDRLPSLKFMRTLWLCAVAGGPLRYTATKPGKTEVGLEEAHRDLKIAPDEFDEVRAELGRTLDVFKVPPREKEEVLSAFAAHKNEVTTG
jgi:hemoglobin